MTTLLDLGQYRQASSIHRVGRPHAPHQDALRIVFSRNYNSRKKQNWINRCDSGNFSCEIHPNSMFLSLGRSHLESWIPQNIKHFRFLNDTLRKRNFRNSQLSSYESGDPDN